MLHIWTFHKVLFANIITLHIRALKILFIFMNANTDSHCGVVWLYELYKKASAVIICKVKTTTHENTTVKINQANISKTLEIHTK